MSRFRITCINKDDRQSPHKRIQNVGGNGWKITQQSCINHIKNKTHSFYVSVNWNEVDVIVATREGIEYIKTRNDGDEPNNLLSLMECIS